MHDMNFYVFIWEESCLFACVNLNGLRADRYELDGNVFIFSQGSFRAVNSDRYLATGVSFLCDVASLVMYHVLHRRHSEDCDKITCIGLLYPFLNSLCRPKHADTKLLPLKLAYGPEFTICPDPDFTIAQLNNVGQSSKAPTTEYIFYCKRTILFLSSSKILSPHPPLRPASVYPPPLLPGEVRLAGRRGGWGVNILEDERNRIALLQ